LQIVIIKYLFTPQDVLEDNEVPAILQEELKRECESKIGKVKRVVIYEFHPDGVAEVKFESPAHAKQCIELMHGRDFNG
jgi:HIV Tat-specific factor 1